MFLGCFGQTMKFLSPNWVWNGHVCVRLSVCHVSKDVWFSKALTCWLLSSNSDVIETEERGVGSRGRKTGGLRVGDDEDGGRKREEDDKDEVGKSRNEKTRRGGT